MMGGPGTHIMAGKTLELKNTFNQFIVAAEEPQRFGCSPGKFGN
jgi:hypothetical protein